MPTALLSPHNKEGLGDFAYDLLMLGYNLLGSAEAAKHLNECGVPTRDIAELVGPPILGGRAAMLSPEIYAALVADDSLEDRAELVRIRMPRIDLVYVNLHPLMKETVSPGMLVAKTDIDGLMLLHSAIRGRRLVLSSSGQFPLVLKYIRDQSQPQQGANEHERFISWLVWQAEAAVARYCHISANYRCEHAQTAYRFMP